MKLLKILIIMTLVLVLVYFLTQNSGDDSKVAVDLLFLQFKKTNISDDRASVSMIILGSLTVGIFFGYLSAVFSILSSKSQIRNLQNKNRRLTDELNDLRNVAIDEGIYDTEGGDY
tara:strand:+ start:643 stop:990 length:348 start_codon:yes stop_codon:yes gene_type:complete